MVHRPLWVRHTLLVQRQKVAADTHHLVEAPGGEGPEAAVHQPAAHHRRRRSPPYRSPSPPRPGRMHLPGRGATRPRPHPLQMGRWAAVAGSRRCCHPATTPVSVRPSSGDLEAGVVFAPPHLAIHVSEAPFLGLYFSPVRVAVSGTIGCLGEGGCPDLGITLKSEGEIMLYFICIPLFALLKVFLLVLLTWIVFIKFLIFLTFLFLDLGILLLCGVILADAFAREPFIILLVVLLLAVLLLLVLLLAVLLHLKLPGLAAVRSGATLERNSVWPGSGWPSTTRSRP